MAIFTVRAHWDADAGVWWAESNEVPGLVAEAAAHDDLVAELKALVPELLALNLPAHAGGNQLRIVSDRVEELSAA